MDKNLPGFVLNALDDAERREIEEALSRDPEAAARLEAMRQVLAPLAADAETPVPPPHLVVNTLARIAEHSCVHLPPAPKPRIYQGESEALQRRWFRRPDVLVAAAMLILVGGLCVPALDKGWNNYQIQSCKNNLAQFGTAFQVYSDFHEGRFPQVEPVDGPRGLAGVVVPLLFEAGALDPQINVACPAEGQQRPGDFTVADLEAVYGQRPTDFVGAARTLLPGYAYSLGYEEGGQLLGPRRDQGDLVPLMADRPGILGGNSANHGGDGQNVLYSAGHVRWCSERTVGEDRDDIYLNQNFKVLAGLGRADTVLGSSFSSPVQRPVPK